MATSHPTSSSSSLSRPGCQQSCLRTISHITVVLRYEVYACAGKYHGALMSRIEQVLYHMEVLPVEK